MTAHKGDFGRPEQCGYEFAPGLRCGVGNQVPEGRCPATECWYTLPLNADGLVVQHSQPGTLSTCEGGGRPPHAAAAADQPGEEADGLPNIRSITADTVCECEHDRGQHDDLGNCWHMDSAGDEDCDCDQFRQPAPSAGQDTERLRDELIEVLAPRLAIGGAAAARLADALLDGPLRQLIAERDQAVLDAYEAGRRAGARAVPRPLGGHGSQRDGT